MTGLTCVREELAGRFACLPPHGSDFAHLTSLKHFADIYRFRAFAPNGAKFRLYYGTPPSPMCASLCEMRHSRLFPLPLFPGTPLTARALTDSQALP